ncbi:MAG TPA: serine hydrolase domain-containing protein [Planctomycetota bacterium]
MTSLLRFHGRAPARALASLLVVSTLALAASAQSELVGTWDGTYEPPGVVGGDPFSLQITAQEGERVRGTVVLPELTASLEGRFDRARGVLTGTLTSSEEPVTIEWTLAGDALRGSGTGGPWQWAFRATRASVEVLPRDHSPRLVDLSEAERPATYDLEGLDTELAIALDELVRASAEKNDVVGLSVAVVIDGKLVDVRSLGWEDFFAGTPASGETRYRWASISKPLTATAALRLAARGGLDGGGLDLDCDVRSLVPEFPAKQVGEASARITPRQILCHQSGIVHYEGATRVWREYPEPYPFEHLVNALDVFASAPLLFAPGTRQSYSTHAWSLLGLALERAAKQPYPELVRALVLEPAGMRQTEPDFLSRSIPHRSKGYETNDAGKLIEVFGDDVAWKLPGGGWISTVGDLARFGAALCGPALLDEAQQEAAWTRQRLADGKETDVGLGFFLEELDGRRLVSHSGGQRKASSFLAVLPEEHLAVAVMSNTARTPMGELARAALRLLLAGR